MNKVFYLKAAIIVLATVFYACTAEEKVEDLTDEDLQRVNMVKNKYARLQQSFQGGYFVELPTISPYSAGKVKQEVLQSGVDAVNLMRYIAGIADDVELSAEYTEMNQHGAVLLSAIKQLTHNPSKPQDMSDEFYQIALKGTSSSNISTTNLPSATIFMYINDSGSGNIERVGHRRWILNPPMKKTGFGVGANGYGLMYAFDRSRGNVDYDYVAWPSPGVFPLEFASKDLAWSISVNAQKYGAPEINKVKLTLKHVNSGKIWTFSNHSSTTGNNEYFNIDTAGYGINNCIIFRPGLPSSFVYQEGDEFRVTVSGLENSINYSVKMFSIKQ